MNRKLLKVTVFTLLLTLILSGCTSNSSTDLEKELKEKDERIAELEEENQTIKERLEELKEERSDKNIETSLLAKVIDVIEIIRDSDMENLSRYVHPSKGLRFSPYDYVDIETHQVFTKKEVAALGVNNEVYTWGSYDGSGEPIELNFSDYYNRFVYDVNFASPHMIGNNTQIGTGNAVNNIEEAYPNGHFIEFHFKGFDPELSGIDWKSLKLVFEQEDGEWYLVGIIHGEWTI